MLPERRQQILVVDDEPNLRRVLAAQLQRDGYDVHTAEDGAIGLELLREHHVDLVITDLKMPNLDGMGLLRAALQLEPELPVIIITAHGTVDNAVEALKTGAFDYITKPFEQNEVRAIVRKALDTRRLSATDARLLPEASGFGLIGVSDAIGNLAEVLSRVADTPTTVLLIGEGGTGKDALARAIHDNSSRRGRPFIKVNCAALAPEYVESELFGAESMSFGGTVHSRPGRFELAHGGTLFLEEVGDVPIEVQSKLLRAVQEGAFERVSGVRTIHVDVRLVASSVTDLRVHVAQRRFREDLFYRLNVVPIALPPLRERKMDIAPLCFHYIQKFNQRLKKQVSGISDAALEVLYAYSFPGNVRELENLLEYAVLFCDGGQVGPMDFPQEPIAEKRPQGDDEDQSLGLKAHVKEVTSRLERGLIQRALDQKHGNVTHAARLLKISRKGLQLKMKELGLREREDRTDG
ncbi:MAG: hypothetical protein RJA70_1381 [Pseudomonadota bacterium]|jgi:DNA-binding NtrC family response regulator